MDQPDETLRILLLEDVPTDAELVVQMLQEEGLDFTSMRVDTEAAFMQALQEFKPHIVLADYRLPAYSGRAALQYTRRAHPQIPVIMVTGALGDEAAVELLKFGAKDYVLKGNLARLAHAVKRTLSEERGIRNRKIAEGKYRTLFSEARDGIVLFDHKTEQVSDCNSQFERMSGRSVDELKVKKIWEFVSPEKLEMARKMFLNISESGSAIGELELQKPDGTITPVEISSVIVNLQDNSIIQAIVRDMTERKVAERALRRSNRALQTLSAGNLAQVRASSEEKLLREVTKVIVEKCGYGLVTVDYAQDNPEKSIAPMAWSGTAENYSWVEHLSWADTEQGQLPVSRAIRSGTTQICHDIANETAFKPWKDAALAHGYVSNIALPLSDGGRTFGGLSIYSSEASAFDLEEVVLMEEMATDLSYGINTLRTRIERDHALEQELRSAAKLRQALEQTIAAIALTLEKRDPYTAGHQQRVGKLATAIANEMGLQPQQVEGIHFGALLHNIGTVSVPAEILNRPGKLRDAQFALIKLHPQSGFEIVKDIPLPWPVAQMVLQHHERLDGSGYPQGLKGEQIMLEARILAVADVLEAMLSFRPYRPALATAAALDTLAQGRGTQFDPAVVDACLRVIKKNVEWRVRSADAIPHS